MSMPEAMPALVVTGPSSTNSRLVSTFAEGIADQAGSLSIVGAAERGVAETAALLTKAGIPTQAIEGANR